MAANTQQDSPHSKVISLLCSELVPCLIFSRIWGTKGESGIAVELLFLHFQLLHAVMCSSSKAKTNHWLHFNDSLICFQVQ